MPKVKLHYVIRNGGDGSASVGFYADSKSAEMAAELETEAFCENGPYEAEFEFDAKGKLLNPDKSKAALERELAEARGEETEGESEEEEESPKRSFSSAAGPKGGKDQVFKGELHYVVRNCGDGSAMPDFYADQECADLATQIEEEGGEMLDDNPHCMTLKFDGKGVLLNPTETRKELDEQMAERKEEEEARAERFRAAAAPKPTPVAETPKPAATQAEKAPAAFDVTGKHIVFTGKLSTMTRSQAESMATNMGAQVSGAVSGKTDILVVGEDAGNKLAKARGLGVTIMTEAEWNAAIVRRAVQGKPGTPKP